MGSSGVGDWSGEPIARDRLVERLRELSRPLDPIPTGVEARLDRCRGTRAVLFDVYGTLLVSASGGIGLTADDSRAIALRGALEALGAVEAGASEEAAGRGATLLGQAIAAEHARSRSKGILHPEVEICEVWAGVLARLREEGLLSGSAGRVREEVERLAIEYEGRVNPVWPMPRLGESIAALRGGGLRLGIVSNAQFFTPLLFPALLDRELAGLGFDPELCVWSFRQREAKPSAGLFRAAVEPLCRREGIEPAEALFVGNDQRNDVAAAAAAGLRTALFAGDRRSLRLREDDPAARAFRPDAVITSLDQLATVVGVPG